MNGVAIIGMAGRFPGAQNVREFWQNLVAGKETISFFTPDELEATPNESAGIRNDPHYVRARGFLKVRKLLTQDFSASTRVKRN